MADFAAFRALAKRLIDANGRVVTIRQMGNSPSADDTEPWRADDGPVQATVTGVMVFVADKTRLGVQWSFARETVQGIKSDNAVALFAAASDNGEELEGFDEIVDGSVVWEIQRVEILQPADDRILYVFEVTRR